MAKDKNYGLDTSPHGASSLKEGFRFDTKKQKVSKTKAQVKAIKAKMGEERKIHIDRVRALRFKRGEDIPDIRGH